MAKNKEGHKGADIAEQTDGQEDDADLVKPGAPGFAAKGLLENLLNGVVGDLADPFNFQGSHRKGDRGKEDEGDPDSEKDPGEGIACGNRRAGETRDGQGDRDETEKQLGTGVEGMEVVLDFLIDRPVLFIFEQPVNAGEFLFFGVVGHGKGGGFFQERGKDSGIEVEA